MYREKIREALEAKKAEAQVIRADFDEKRTKLEADGYDPVNDKESFDEVLDISRALQGKNEEIAQLTSQWEAAVEIDATHVDGQKNGSSPFESKAGEIELRGEPIEETPGDRFVNSKELKQLQESG